MPRESDEVEFLKRTCLNCGRKVAHDSPAHCSESCELEYLRKQVKEKDKRLQQLSRKKGPVKCLGRVEWLRCTQEWYFKDSYDAKRRANELRKLGYGCSAQSIGEIPVDNGEDVPMVGITLLTIWETHCDLPKPPLPEKFIDGLRALRIEVQ